MKLAIGSDHAGYRLKSRLIAWLRSASGGRHHVQDVGCPGLDSCDYPDFAAAVARSVKRGRASRGILICGTGIGMGMAANKIAGIRAAVSWNPATAALAAEHNDANVLCLPARFVGSQKAQDMIRAFLRTPFGGGRHARRVRKINQLMLCLWLLGGAVLLRADDATSSDMAAQHFQAGLAYERLGRLQDAYTELQLACALETSDAKMALALGVVALRLGREEVAQRSLEHSLALDANSVASYYELALLYEKQKAIERAIDSWNRFLDLNRDELLKIEARRHIHVLESQRS